mmetsp:Transcript_11927/g.41094  ORF Transcript_11927/g.41094 Transcript_11927/m.41094 type:complete len:407 (-) Transcript_11927:977-2197(-)
MPFASFIHRDESVAQQVIQEMLPMQDIHDVLNDLHSSQSSNEQEMRMHILQLRTMMKSLINMAEVACHEVERRCQALHDLRSSTSADSITNKSFQNKDEGERHVYDPEVSELFPNFISFNSDSSPIPYLQTIQSLVRSNQLGEHWDLLQDNVKRRGFNTTIGIRLAMNSNAADLRPLQVQLVIPGSPAHVCGMLDRGDEIVAVDGESASEATIVSQVSGTDVVGSRVTLTIKKKGSDRTFDIPLVRVSWSVVEAKEKIFILMEQLMKQISQDGSKRISQEYLSLLYTEMKEYEKFRAINEMHVQDRLYELRSSILQLAQEALEHSETIIRVYNRALMLLGKNKQEVFRDRETYLKAQVRERENRLGTMNMENEALKQRLQKSDKLLLGMEKMCQIAFRKKGAMENS